MQANKRVCRWRHNGMLSRGIQAYPGAYAPRPAPPETQAPLCASVAPRLARALSRGGAAGLCGSSASAPSRGMVVVACGSQGGSGGQRPPGLGARRRPRHGGDGTHTARRGPNRKARVHPGGRSAPRGARQAPEDAQDQGERRHRRHLLDGHGRAAPPGGDSARPPPRGGPSQSIAEVAFRTKSAWFNRSLSQDVATPTRVQNRT